jgi:hypothetical protein
MTQDHLWLHPNQDPRAPTEVQKSLSCARLNCGTLNQSIIKEDLKHSNLNLMIIHQTHFQVSEQNCSKCDQNERSTNTRNAYFSRSVPETKQSIQFVNLRPKVALKFLMIIPDQVHHGSCNLPNKQKYHLN